jgi:glutaminyl-peptide cyclotransferase
MVQSGQLKDNTNNYSPIFFIQIIRNMLMPINRKHCRCLQQVAVMLFIGVFAVSCRNETKEQTITMVQQQSAAKRVAAPFFNSDSAFSFVQAQVDFGPRIPGTPAHSRCADYLTAKLKSYGFEVILQKGTVQTYDGKKFSLKNIIGSYKPELKSRILVCSHWDTRPWADEDEKDANKPFDGANDGASGVGTGLELARQIQLLPPAIGVDIIFFDLEDYGETGGDDETSWCLGSQYWSKNLHTPDYYANFGILLDMVGGVHAVFSKEEGSVNNASAIVDKIWKTANSIGYGPYFSPQTREYVGTDDHLYVNQAGIPCVDIIPFDEPTKGFGDFHHTHKDNMSIIDKTTLKAVGQTLLEVLYNEK